jgi:hypothetical protein
MRRRNARKTGPSLLVRVVQAAACLLAGCGVSAVGFLGFGMVAATGAFRGSTGAPWLIAVTVFLTMPAVAGLFAGIYVAVRGTRLVRKPPPR